jgi:hypothetical protein
MTWPRWSAAWYTCATPPPLTLVSSANHRSPGKCGQSPSAPATRALTRRRQPWRNQGDPEREPAPPPSADARVDANDVAHAVSRGRLKMGRRDAQHRQVREPGNTVSPVDAQGRQLATKTIDTYTKDHLGLLTWAEQFTDDGHDVVWAVSQTVAICVNGR